MDVQVKNNYPMAYKKVSHALLFLFVGYWVFTIALVSYKKTVRKNLPRTYKLYNCFFTQNWRLFTHPNIVNRELAVVLRDKTNPLKTDTINTVDYIIKEKRKYAPFNNYEDVIDHALYRVLSNFEDSIYAKRKLLRLQMPNQPKEFYRLQTNLLMQQDSKQQKWLANLENYCKYVLAKTKTDTLNKEYQMVIIYNYMPLAQPDSFYVENGVIPPSFISNFKSFK